MAAEMLDQPPPSRPAQLAMPPPPVQVPSAPPPPTAAPAPPKAQATISAIRNLTEAVPPPTAPAPPAPAPPKPRPRSPSPPRFDTSPSLPKTKPSSPPPPPSMGRTSKPPPARSPPTVPTDEPPPPEAPSPPAETPERPRPVAVPEPTWPARAPSRSLSPFHQSPRPHTSPSSLRPAQPVRPSRLCYGLGPEDDAAGAARPHTQPCGSCSCLLAAACASCMCPPLSTTHNPVALHCPRLYAAQLHGPFGSLLPAATEQLSTAIALSLAPRAMEHEHATHHDAERARALASAATPGAAALAAPHATTAPALPQPPGGLRHTWSSPSPTAPSEFFFARHRHRSQPWVTPATIGSLAVGREPHRRPATHLTAIQPLAPRHRANGSPIGDSTSLIRRISHEGLAPHANPNSPVHSAHGGASANTGLGTRPSTSHATLGVASAARPRLVSSRSLPPFGYPLSPAMRSSALSVGLSDGRSGGRESGSGGTGALQALRLPMCKSSASLPPVCLRRMQQVMGCEMELRK